MFKFSSHHKILIAGAFGMVGSSLVRLLKGKVELLTPTREELDLTCQAAVREYLKVHKPDCVIIAAAKVGGIYANMTYPAEFMYDNLMIECNLIHESHKNDVNHLLFLGSTCIYPREAPQPITEEALLTSPLEKTNEAYALAKIAGVKMCAYYQAQYQRRYLSLMPTNLYGYNDFYHLENAHVIPALMLRFQEAKEKALPHVSLWGSGSPLREFLFVDDLAKACVTVLENYEGTSHLNVGSDQEVSIKELAHMIKEVVGYEGEIMHDLSKPDGTPRKKTDTRRLEALGWSPSLSLREGLMLTYQDFLEQRERSLARL